MDSAPVIIMCRQKPQQREHDEDSCDIALTYYADCTVLGMDNVVITVEHENMILKEVH